MKQILKSIILENQSQQLPDIQKRFIQIPINLNIIISIIGVRRSGKTYLLYDRINSLLKSGTPRENILYLNFEDERLNLTSDSLDLIIQSYTELFPSIKLSDCYLFFDEIQNVVGWEKFIRRLFDTKTRQIYITGSNSKLLSTEIATELRGRTLTFTVYPLSLSEYLDFNKIEKKIYPQQNKSTIIHYTEQFIYGGGFPEILFFDELNKRKMLQQYFNVMLIKDIVERYNISDISVLKFFIKKIVASVTKPFSINKTYNDLKSMGYKVSNKYLYNYFDYCSDIFLSKALNRFDFSEIKQEKSEKKVYISDNGLLRALEFSVSQNKGKLLENMVAMEFFKAESEVFYFKGSYECDFITLTNGKYSAIQVCYDLTDKYTLQRELRGLLEACKYLNIKTGIILTFDSSGEFTENEIHITAIPVYEYFLNLKL